MNWTTEVEVSKSHIRIDWEMDLAFIGSCFAENMARRFSRFKFHTLENPFGVVYNPLSLERMLCRIAKENLYLPSEVFFDGESFHCWDFHGDFSAKTLEVCLQQMNEAVKKAHHFLQSAKVVFVTLGTARCYFHKESGTVVSNCHRQSADLFYRELISVEQTVQALESAVRHLQNLNPQVRIVLTVSPLRHLKDGLHENQISKATLLLAVHQIVKRFSNVEYFPSYEIVVDELRDYRFYAADMVHLSSVAEDYIFEKMGAAYFDLTVQQHLPKLNAFLKSAEHRIVDMESAKLRTFAEGAILTAKRLESEVRGLDLSAEIHHFESCLKK